MNGVRFMVYAFFYWFIFFSLRIFREFPQSRCGFFGNFRREVAVFSKENGIISFRRVYNTNYPILSVFRERNRKCG